MDGVKLSQDYKATTRRQFASSAESSLSNPLRKPFIKRTIQPISSQCTLSQTPENLTVFWCFQGVKKGCIRKEWFKADTKINNLRLRFFGRRREGGRGVSKHYFDSVQWAQQGLLLNQIDIIQQAFACSNLTEQCVKSVQS